MRDFDHIQALNWVRHSTVPPAPRFISRLSSKPKRRKAPVVNYTIESKKDVVLKEHGTRQMSQTFHVALDVHTFATI